MNNSQGKDKIYDDLKGYFPAEYDLTPDELEKEIETENKKREIALSMMRTKLRSAEGEGEIDSAQEKKSGITPPSPAKDSAPSLSSLTERFTSTEALKDVDCCDADGDEETVAPFETSDTDSIQFIVTDGEDSEDSEDVIEDTEIAAPAHSEPETNIPKALDDELHDVFEDASLDELFTEMESTEKKSPKDAEDKETATRKNVSWFFDFLEVFAICITCIIVIFAIFFRLTKVSGESMENTLFDKEYLIVSDLFYTPEVGDIVVIQNVSLENPLLCEPLVKRVMAVGGQTVSISQNGIVTLIYEDGTKEILDQPFTKSEPYAGISGRYEVPEGYVFVMGDNRNHSTDSRSPMVGLVDERCIFGKAIVRVLPVNTFTFFENPYND